MIAIGTKYIPCTNYRPSRVKAFVLEPASGSWGRRREITISWDSALNSDENHTAAALALIAKHGWDQPCYTRNGLFRGGSEHGYVFVFGDDPVKVA